MDFYEKLFFLFRNTLGGLYITFLKTEAEPGSEPW